MVSSIRAQLLLWYGAMLLATVGAFAVFLYAQQSRTLLREFDQRLLGAAQVVATGVELDEEGLDVELPKEFLAAFSEEGPEVPSISVWDGAGRLVYRTGPPSPSGDAAPQQLGLRTSAGRREWIVQGQGGLRVVVGQSRATLDRRLAGFGSWLLAGSLFALTVASFGGWLLVGRVLAPIRRMSEAAAELSAANLSRRIDLSRTESELGQLASTLNGAFDRLQRTVEEQKRFVADASHELRTPVAVVLASTEHALAKERDAADYREALCSIERAAGRLRGVVEGMLILTRAEAARTHSRRQSFDLAALLTEVTVLLDPLARSRGITLEYRSCGPAIQVSGDPDRLREVFVNLVSNGIQYNRPGGRVTLGVASVKSHLIVTVSDTGCGIPSEHLPRIWERFYRGDPARESNGSGCGLGLAIAKAIIEQHGGSIDAQSTPEVGSEFTVRLPR